MKKICIISVYFGKWPSWFDYYLKSCEFNPSVNWLIYTDCKIPKNASKNVRFINGSLEDFNKLASEKININININNPYKLCDFKPAYGLIFEDYLKDFDFWGHSDIDLIYGNIRKFITDEILLEFDVISARKRFLTGHFALFRNVGKINQLFKRVLGYKEILQNSKYCGLDECGMPFSKIFCQKQSMTFIVKNLAKKNIIKIYFREMVKAGKRGGFKLYFNKGNLIDILKNKEVLYLHFSFFLKGYYEILIPKNKNIPNNFYITHEEIFFNKQKFSIRRLKRRIRIFINKDIDRNIGRMGIFLKNISPKLYNFFKGLIKYF